MPFRVFQLVFTDAAKVKLGARGISTVESEQLLHNRHETMENPRGRGRERIFLVGRTNGGRPLTLVAERSIDPTTWLVVTGWETTRRGRSIVD